MDDGALRMTLEMLGEKIPSAVPADVRARALEILRDGPDLLSARGTLDGILAWYAALPQPGLIPNLAEFSSLLREAQALTRN